MARVNPGGWLTGDPLTAAQTNALDINQDAHGTSIAAAESDITSIESAATALGVRVTTLEDSKDCASYTLGDSGGTINIATGAKVPLTQVINSTGFTLASNEVEVPAAGKYLVTVNGRVDCGSTPQSVGLNICEAGIPVTSAFGRNASGGVGVAGSYILNVTTPASSKISVESGAAVDSGVYSAYSMLTIVRLS
jgi:hypothetical protein